MTRTALILALLLSALPLAAADIPLSDRPLAPFRVSLVGAAASPEAVLVAFTTGADVFVQRLTLDGEPIDREAISVGSSEKAPTSLLAFWEGRQWIVLWRSPSRVAWIDRNGFVDGPWDFDWTHAVLIRDRVTIATSEYATSYDTIARLFELPIPGLSVPSGAVVFPTTSPFWLLGLDRGVGVLSYDAKYAPPVLDVTFGVYLPGAQTSRLTLDADATKPDFQLVPGPSGGGLLLWNRNGVRGAIVAADSRFTAPFAIGPAGAVEGSVEVAAHEGGWDVIFHVGATSYLAEVSSTGAVMARPLDSAVTVAERAALVRAGGSDLLFEPRSKGAGGVAVRAISGAHVTPPSTIGLRGATQSKARTAAGGGLDVVVWEEESDAGTTLRATRIGPDGLPLDGAGILVTAGPLIRYPASERFDVAHDGEAFVIAWVLDEGAESDRALTRRLLSDGSLSEPRSLAAWRLIYGVDVAGAGGGRSAATWWELDGERSPRRSVFVPILRGEPGDEIEIASGYFARSLPRLAASGDWFLAVFTDRGICSVTCAPDPRPRVRMFTLDGAPVDRTRSLSEIVAFDLQVVSDGRDFFIVWSDVLVRVDADLTIHPAQDLARGGELSLQGTELRIDQGFVRAVYSLGGALLRFEPLPLGPGDRFALALPRDRIIASVPAHPPRLVIRDLLDPEPGVADLAVVATGEISCDPPWRCHATFRVEHRDGAPVSRIAIWSRLPAYVPGESCNFSSRTVLDRELREGESFEFEQTIYPECFNPDVWVAGDAIDANPANNVDRYERPVRHRGRVTARP